MAETVDAVVVGSGPNGLAGAILLADAGWDVLVLEDQPTPGGAVRTEELTEPGFHSDVMSAFYPLGAASPVMRALGLEDHGLRWRHAELVLAHPSADGTCAALSRDLGETAASLDAFAPGDGDAWRALYARWERAGPHLLRALFGPFPPLRALPGLAVAGGPGLAAMALRSARGLGARSFRGEGGRRLLLGSALHTDVMPGSVGGGLYGWLLCALGQQVGWPVPAGGAGNLAAALMSRLRAAGGRVECGERVVAVRTGGVRTASGREVAARRAVLADVSAPALYGELVDPAALPWRVRAGLRRFRWDDATVKLDWSLDGPIPWAHPDARRAGTLHVADGVDEMAAHAAALDAGRTPEAPFLLVGQYAAYDPARQPPGKETAWAYTHLPQGLAWDPAFPDRMEAMIERVAPGFRALIRRRHVLAPHDLEARDRNLHGGALGGGTARLRQQLVLRPVPGLARPETGIRGVYLASASAHPGGGVHGACGANAAKAALLHARLIR